MIFKKKLKLQYFVFLQYTEFSQDDLNSYIWIIFGINSRLIRVILLGMHLHRTWYSFKKAAKILLLWSLFGVVNHPFRTEQFEEKIENWLFTHGFTSTQTGADWPFGAPGRFPVADLARCPVFFIYLLLFIFWKYYNFYFFCLPNVPKWSFPIVAFPNKSIINHKSVSLDWLRFRSVPCLRQTVLNRVVARDSRKERKRSEETVKCSEITNLFRASSAGQFHL